MSRLNYENVHLRIDDRKKECYRNDMNKIVLCEEYDVYKDEVEYENAHYPNREGGKKGIWD